MCSVNSLKKEHPLACFLGSMPGLKYLHERSSMLHTAFVEHTKHSEVMFSPNFY